MYHYHDDSTSTTTTHKKINTKSSTEAELVAVDDSLNFVVWVKQLFFGWQMQDYKEDNKIKMLGRKNIIQQDNTSAIQLERFGKKSSTKRARHLSIKYFYITSLLANKTISAITYVPTKELIADYFSKPLQGSLFRKHRNTLMGITELDKARHHELYMEKYMKT